MARLTSTLLLNLKPSSSSSLFLRPNHSLFSRLFSRNTKVNFSLSDSESEPENNDSRSPETPPAHKPNLPPPYDPFTKTQTHPNDPTNLQEIFHNIRTNGLHDHAVKMFDALSRKHNLTHEALELFSQIQTKGQMPEVIAHTAVIQAYADAGKPKEALKVFERMLACGVSPNAYTYSVLVECLCGSGSGEWKMVKEGVKWFCEMMGKGIRPSDETSVAVFEGVVRCGKVDEGREVVRRVEEFGFGFDEKGVREVLKGKRGPVYRDVVDVMFGK